MVVDKKPAFYLKSGDQERPIKFAGAFVPTSEYTIQEFRFTDEFGKEADGCLFEILPFGSTRVIRIIEEGVKCEEMAVGGTGHFVGIGPDGKIFTLPVNADQEENPLVAQQTGSIGVWIAGEKGLVVVNITQPPFDPRYEEEVKRNDPEIPGGFWGIYDELKGKRPDENVQKILKFPS